MRTASAARIVLRTPAFLTGSMTRLVSRSNLRHPPPMTQGLNIHGTEPTIIARSQLRDSFEPERNRNV